MAALKPKRKDKGRETLTEFVDSTNGKRMVAITCPACLGRGCGGCDGKGFTKEEAGDA